MKKQSISWLLLAALLLKGACTTSFCQEVTQAIDRRTRHDPSGDHYYLVFCARSGSITGHGFIIWSHVCEQSQSWQEVAYGFYPRTNLRHGLLVLAPGNLRRENLAEKGQLVTHQLIVEVNPSVFHTTQRAISDWSGQKYSLVRHNCVHFLKDVAIRCGLRVPPCTWGTTPRYYMERLIQMNQQSLANHVN